MLHDFLYELNRLMDKAEFASTCCQNEGDMMYRSIDDSWWKRTNKFPHRASELEFKWERCESPPKGYKKEIKEI